MYKASSAYKRAMSKRYRDRGYISVGIGLINNRAQADCGFDTSDLAEWSTPQFVLSDKPYEAVYSTFEQNFVKADGSKVFMPELDQFVNNGITSKDLLGAVKIVFNNPYDIKGLTIDFGDAYPTEFRVDTDKGTKTFTNSSREFIVYNGFGEINEMTITPITMVGGSQRLRIFSLKLGVGLTYTNNDIESATYSENCSPISAECPEATFNLTIRDPENKYNVDSSDSYINYLFTKQQVTVSYGMTLEDGTIEWIPSCKMYLDSWKSKKGKMSFTAKSIFEFIDGEYSLGNKVYSRTAYEEIEQIFTDAGFEIDEYYIDYYLHDIELTNPIPVCSHKEALQLVANACKCVVYENYDGRAFVEANFENSIDADEITVTSPNAAPWSTLQRVAAGAIEIYSDMSYNNITSDERTTVMPENASEYSGLTGYVSNEVADEGGNFTENPKVVLTFPASYTYFAVRINFGGTPPKGLIISTKLYGEEKDEYYFDDLTNDSFLVCDLIMCNEISFEVTEGNPNQRIYINKISFGNLSDYVLDKDTMTDSPTGYSDKRTRNVKVKVYTFAETAEGPQEIKDEVYYTKNVNATGEDRILKNPLISDIDMAEDVGKWIANYYKNNISYSIPYRGEPRIHASDIIYLDNGILNNLQTEIESCKLTFKGAFSGSLEVRRALKMISSDEISSTNA